MCDKKNRIGENNPNWKGGYVEYTCQNCGIKFTPKDHANRIRKFCSHKCSKMGGNNPQWKDSPGYAGVHCWGYRHVPKPKSCTYCGEDKKLDLANESGEYKREVNDWVWLCRKCHMIKDGVTQRLIEYSKSMIKYSGINCKQCGVLFKQYFKDQKFCSKPCSTIFYNKNVRVYKKKQKT